MTFIPRRGWKIGLTGVGVFGALYLGDLVVSVLTAGPLLAGQPECPHDSDTLPLGNPSLPVGIAAVPEFHDCQRFLVQDDATGDLRFDSLFAIFVGPELGRLPDSLGFAAPRPTGTIRSTVRSVPVVGTLAIPATAGASPGAAFAEIYAEGTYEPLGILAPGFWCLVMSAGDTGGVTVWRARMISRQDMPDDTCRQPAPIPNPRALPGTELEARDDDITGYLPSQVPFVGRWDWDPINFQHYIGVAGCSGWCEVGDSGFVASRTYPVPGFQFAPVSPTRRIKGWYDEQILAVLPSDGSSLTPSLLVGTVFPDPQLGNQSVSDFTQWTRVAFVQIDTLGLTTSQPMQTALQEYQATYGFDPAMHPYQLNEVSMCRGSDGDCLPWYYNLWILRHLIGPPDCKNTDHDDSVEWWVRVDRRDGGSKYRCVIFRDIEAAIGVPPTVRWRWKIWDEGIWARCPEGCCEME